MDHFGTKRLLAGCAKNSSGMEKFILVSGQAVAVPSQDARSAAEADSPHPVSGYGKSKLLAEKVVQACQDHFSVVILRQPCVYGPRNVDVFELFRWVGSGLTIEISGYLRYLNLCYLEDLTAALLLSVRSSTKSGSVYFVAEKRSYSWSEFVVMLLSSCGVQGHTVKIPYGAAYLAWSRVRNRKPVH